MNQKVELDANTIKNLEQQFGQVSARLNQYQPSTLPNNTIQNLKRDSHCLSITTQSGEATIDPHIRMVDDVKNDTMDVNDKDKTKTRKLVTRNKVY